MSVAAVILAAGGSTRFEDGHKLLAEIDGVPMVRRVALEVAASSVSEILLVVEVSDNAVAQTAGSGRWRLIENADAQAGLSTSLRAGFAAVSSDASGAAIVLADMPHVSAALIDGLVSAFEPDASRIVFPCRADGRQGHPVIWPRSLFAELVSLTGDVGAKDLIGRHAGLCRPVMTDDAGAFADIDTRTDLAVLLERRD